MSEVQSNTDGTEFNGKYMRYLKDKPCNNGENHHVTGQGNCRAKAPIHISQDGSLKVGGFRLTVLCVFQYN